MIIRGAHIEGAKLSSPGLLSVIGDPIFWFDYRRNIKVDGSNNILSWDSIASNYGVGRLRPPATGGIYLYAGGVGWSGPTHGTPGTRYLQPANTADQQTKMNQRFLSNQKYAIFTVGFCNNRASGDNNSRFRGLTIRNPQNTQDRFDWVPVRTLNGSQIQVALEPETSATQPDDQYFLTGVVHYGAGSNNVRMIMGSSESISTNSAGAQTSGPFVMFQIFGWANAAPTFLIKFQIAYNLNGLSNDQINNVFLPLFYSTLKEDAEYSSIVTP